MEIGVQWSLCSTNYSIKKLINLNGNNKQAITLEDRKYSLIFYPKSVHEFDNS